MSQIMKSQTQVLPERAIYEDADFSDIEVKALMHYFRVATYEGLKSLLAAMRKSNLGY